MNTMLNRWLHQVSLVVLAMCAMAVLVACGEDSSDPAGDGGVCAGGYSAGEMFMEDCNTCVCDAAGNITCTELDCSASTSNNTSGGNSNIASTSNNTTGGTSNNTTGGTTGGNTSNNTTGGTSNNTTGNTSNNTTGGTSNNTTGGTTGGTTGPFVCENTFYTGQAFIDEEPDPLSPNGGVAVFESPTEDSGLGPVLDAVPESTEMDMNSATGSWQLTNVTVVATSFNTSNTMRANRIFWVGDSNGVIKVFFGSMETDKFPTFNIKVGQKISFTATEVINFNNVPEIVDVDPESWLLDSEDNDVYIQDWQAGEALAFPGDVNAIVRLTGTLSQEGMGCGEGWTCFELDYGAPSTVVFRTNSQFILPGNCVTYVGPVGSFGGELQLNVENFDWVFNNSPRE